ADVVINKVGLLVHLVGLPQAGDDPAVPVHREDAVVVAVGEQRGPRRDQGGDRRPLPAVIVVEEHAVTVPVDHLVGDVALQVAHAADRDGDLDPLVGGRDPDG